MLICLGYEKEVVFVRGSKKKEFEAKYVSRELLKSVREANRIAIRYSEKDMALHFLLGAAYILIRILGHKKRIVFANREDFKDRFDADEQVYKGGKSYLNVLNYLDKTTGDEK